MEHTFEISATVGKASVSHDTSTGEVSGKICIGFNSDSQIGAVKTEGSVNLCGNFGTNGSSTTVETRVGAAAGPVKVGCETVSGIASGETSSECSAEVGVEIGGKILGNGFTYGFSQDTSLSDSGPTQDATPSSEPTPEAKPAPQPEPAPAPQPSLPPISFDQGSGNHDGGGRFEWAGPDHGGGGFDGGFDGGHDGGGSMLA
jgi:hypothetical protein